VRITDNLEAQGASSAAPDNAPAKSRTRFSDVLKSAKGADVRHQTREELASSSERVAPELMPPLPFSDVAAVESKQGIAPEHEALLMSLVQEIAVEAPPGGNASVNVQFDASTLEGLQVQIQKTAKGVEIQFTTSSEAVSQLLAANAPGLTDALIQRGYVAPNVSVQRTGPAAVPFASEPGRVRSKYDQGRGQKQR
jgi:hypothetical protein